MILVNSKEGDVDKAPKAVKEKFRSLSGSLPMAVVSDPTGNRIYGAYNHADLRSRNFNTIFREAKRAFRADLAKGDLPAPQAEDAEENGTSAATAETPAEAPRTFDNLPMEDWTSAQGSRIKARLTRMDQTTVTLVAPDGRTFTVQRDQLSEESRRRLAALAGR